MRMFDTQRELYYFCGWMLMSATFFALITYTIYLRGKITSLRRDVEDEYRYMVTKIISDSGKKRYKEGRDSMKQEVVLFLKDLNQKDNNMMIRAAAEAIERYDNG